MGRYSSVAIYNAYADALSKASSAAGGTASAAAAVEEPAAKADDEEPKKVEADVPAGTLADGTWTGAIACGVGNEDEWKPYYVVVTLTVRDGKVASIDKVEGASSADGADEALSWDAAENQAYLDWAANGRTRGGVAYRGVLDQMGDALAAGENPASIDTVSGATYSSEAIFKAYYAALEKSAAAAGSTVEVSQGDDPDAPAGPDNPDAPGESGSPDDPGQPSGPSGPSEPSDPSDPDNPDDPDDPDNPDEPDAPALSYVGGFADGTYTGHAYCQDEDSPSAWRPYYIVVTVEAKDGRIVGIARIEGDAEGAIDPNYVYDAGENASYLNRATKGFGIKTKGMKYKIELKLENGEEIGDIDAVSGATWSSRSILAAFNDAVANAQASAQG